MRTILAALVLVTCGVARADTYPVHVLIIRHAEKAGGTGLSPGGKARAAALPKLFMKSDDRPNPFPAPDFIIAAATSDESSRPVDTVTPLAGKLGLPIKADIKDKDYEEVGDRSRIEGNDGRAASKPGAALRGTASSGGYRGR
jgi:hypothetical protein